MTETSPTNSASTADPTTAVDVQDPLPEANWLWRRVYTYVMSLILVVLIAWVLDSLHDLRDAQSLYEIGMRLCWLLAAVLTYYLVAPSAEQITRLVQSARVLRAGVGITRTARAETPEGTKTEVSTVAGGQASNTTTDSPAAPATAEIDYAPSAKS